MRCPHVALALSILGACQLPSTAAGAQRTSGATGAGHVAGDRMVVVSGHRATPILGKAIFWDGNGEVENAGLGVSNYWFAQDWLGLRATANANYFAQDDAAVGIEFETGARLYALHYDGWSAYWDVTGGYQYANTPVPPGGTAWNYTFAGGPGADVRLTQSTDLLIGATFHHISNARGRASLSNPSQNDVRLYVGLGWTW